MNGEQQLKIRHLDHSINVSYIALLALSKITDDGSKEYYKDLDKADLAHNIETLFTELRTIHMLLIEETMEIMGNVNDLKKATHVQ